MKIKVERITSWLNVVNAARFTQYMPPIDHEPSDKFKNNIIRAEHSPLRELVFRVYLYDIPKYVCMHLVRHHEGVEKYVTSSRPDRNGFKTTRHEQRDDDLVDMMMTINAQALINISKVRLCHMAERTTREVWKSVIAELAVVDKVLADYCVPSCITKGFCPEIKPCGFTSSKTYHSWRIYYVGREE